MTAGKVRCVQLAVALIVCLTVLVTWLHVKYDVRIFDVCDVQPVGSEAAAVWPKIECPPEAILCGDKVPGVKGKQQNITVSKSTFHSLMTSLDFECPRSRRFGRPSGDGGYTACMADAVAPRNRSCLVYSFGISNDWTFDEDLARFGCEVHSFDPSIGKQDHLHAPRVNFHNVGLWGSDIIDSHGWKLERLSTIRKRLGHEQRIVDILKVDVEGAEWPFLRDMIFVDRRGLSNVRQLFMELHTPKFTSNAVTATDLEEISVYATRLRENLGFQLYRNVQHNNCCGRFAPIMPPGVPEKCCHEVFYFNSHLLAN